MKMQFHKPLLFGLLLSLLPSCQSNPAPSRTWDHWNAASVPSRVGRFFLGYDSDREGAYIDKLGSDVLHVNKTLKRAFFSTNEDNPFQN
jgi:hypothetical protein